MLLVQAKEDIKYDHFSDNKPGDDCTVVLSGGQDSTTCLFLAKDMGFNIHAVTFDYNQKHHREIDAARKIADLAGVASHEVIELGPILKGASPLTNPDAELEQYANHNVLPGGIEKTFVPMRNQLFLTIAANRACVLGNNILFTGVCEEDSGGYPDCRRRFINDMEYACRSGTFTGEDGLPMGLHIVTPLMHLTKAQSVLLALEIEGCYEALMYSHTSYDGQYPPSGHDHATLLRAKGFEQAGVPDPLVLRAVYEELMPLPVTRNYWANNLPAYIDKLGFEL